MEILKSVSNENLLTGLKKLVQREKALLAEVLTYLREVEARKLFLERGYPSLFAFSVEYLGYSEMEAHVRIQAMRLLRDFSEAEEKLRSGALSLTNAAKIQSEFRREDVRRKSAKELPLGREAKRGILVKMSGASTRECEARLALEFPASHKPGPERIRPRGDGSYSIEFVASRELFGKFERLKGLLSHKNFSGSYATLFSELADIALKKLAPEKPVLKKPNLEKRVSRRPLGAPQVRTRYVPRAVRAEVWRRDEGKCQYKDSVTGRRCDATHGLELDHIARFRAGGENTPENLRLLCDGHNRYREENRRKG